MGVGGQGDLLPGKEGVGECEEAGESALPPAFVPFPFPFLLRLDDDDRGRLHHDALLCLLDLLRLLLHGLLLRFLGLRFGFFSLRFLLLKKS